MLTVNRVSKQYGDTQALSDITLTIPKGICFGLVGPNGAGKSTLIKIISTVFRDFDGHIQFEDLPLNDGVKKKIGYVPQEICLEWSMTALQNLTFFGKLYGLKGKQLKKRAEEVLSQVGLYDRGQDKVFSFSGGMKRRLNIGCALMNDPMLMIMDEPTVGIDPQSRKYIYNMIHDFKQDGRTIIYASHYIEEVEALCDEVVFMDQGHIIEQGKTEDILQKHAIPSVFIKGDFHLPDSIKQIGTVTEKNNGYLITTNQPLDVMNRCITIFQENKGQLERLELVQPKLEDVFFSLTGNQLRD